MNNDFPSGGEEERSESTPQSQGGKARAERLSADDRTAIARQAALARWGTEVPQATHEGPLNIAGQTLSAVVLPNGKRLLTQGAFYLAIGRSRTPKAGTGALTTVDGLPFFLQADVLKPFITQELMASTTPIFFRDRSGRRLVGYDAELLPMVADVYLKFRDHFHIQDKKVPEKYGHIVTACDMLVRSLAKVGIIALVDEATGYQDVRDRRALQAILDRYLRKEYAAWAKRFPDEFYRQIFRLRGWQWKGMKVNRPQCVANYTKDLVWSRLAPGILEEVERLNPKDDRGRRKHRHPQYLTDEIGIPSLSAHLYAVVGLMRAADTWDELLKLVDRAHPKQDDPRQLRLFIEPA